jgi:hypothetical protein
VVREQLGQVKFEIFDILKNVTITVVLAPNNSRHFIGSDSKRDPVLAEERILLALKL